MLRLLFAGAAGFCLTLALVGDPRSEPTSGSLRFQPLGRPGAATPVLSDLHPYGEELLIATSRNPLTEKGAVVYATRDGRSFDPRLERADSEGFLRIRELAGALYVPDVDPPGTLRGRIFISRDGHAFEEAGLSGVVHGYDAADHGGDVVASGGAANDRAVLLHRRAGGSPGSGDLAARWVPAAHLPFQRLQFLAVHGGALYAAKERVGSPVDFVRWTGVPGADPYQALDAVPGEAITFRWYASSRGRLYWSLVDDRGVRLLHSEDGNRWRSIPALAGEFTSDLAELDGTLYALTNTGLWAAADHEHFQRVAPAPEGDPFGFLRVEGAAAPDPLGNPAATGSLAAWKGTLWAGSSRNGWLYRIELPDR